MKAARTLPKALFRLIGAALLVSALAPAARAQYPNRTVKIVSPAPPSGSTDFVARLVQPGLQLLLKQPVIIENRGGAGGYIGSDYVSKASPDGQTLLLGGAFTAITALMHKEPSYNPASDLVPVAVFASVPNVLVAGPHLKAGTLAALIAAAKAHPGKLNVGSNGIGTTLHLSAELFMMRAGISLTHVAYRGWAECVLGLLKGETDMMFDNVSTALPNITAGKTRALAVTAATRDRFLPNTPTLAELGVKNAEVTSWFGIFAPRGTPQPVIDTLGLAFKAISDQPEFQKQVERQGMEVTYYGPQAAAKFWNAEIGKWDGVIRSAGITLQ